LQAEIKQAAQKYKKDLSQWITLAGYILIVIIAIFRLTRFSINHDVGGFLLEVKGLQEGRYYIDMNMPSNLWLPFVSNLISNYLQFYIADIHQSVLFIYAVLCTSLVFYILRDLGTNLTRFAAILGIAGFLLITPGYEFGQREHLFALSCAPLLALQYRRFLGESVPLSISVIVVSVAAFGASQKPFFILFMLAFAGMDFIARKLKGVAWELVLICLFLGLYLCWISVAYPTYFPEILPRALATYGNMRLSLGLALLVVFMKPLTFILLFFSGIVIFGLGMSISASIGSTEIVVFLCFVFLGIATWCLAFVQRLGLEYHFLPFKVFVACSLVILFAWLVDKIIEKLKRTGFAGSKTFLLSMSYMMVTVFFVALFSQFNLKIDPELTRVRMLQDNLTRYLQALPDKTAVLMLSTRVTPITPIHAYADIRWTGIFTNLLGVLPIADPHPTQGTTVLDRKIIFQIVKESFDKPSPQVVFVDVSKVMDSFLGFRHPDIIAFLLEDPDFRRIWSAYKKSDHIETIFGQEVDIYYRRTDL
jgi:hypothetical protein